MGSVSSILSTVVDYAWGMPLVVLLVGGGLYLVVLSRFLPLKGFKHAVMLVCGKYHNKGDAESDGQISHFQALTNALASTVGMGNVGGVAVAIVQGGPGAVFWMWVAALIGMNTKFFECSLSMMYRGKDYMGEVQGGPMYVIDTVLSKRWKPLAIMFSIFCLLGFMPLFNMNQMASFAKDQFGISPEVVGAATGIFVGAILLGGVKSIGRATSKIVPLMCVIYVLSCLYIILTDVGRASEVLGLIFTDAFGIKAAGGGVMGYAFSEVMKTGIKRAAFSNEAGMGSAPMAHSNAKTAEPISEGLVSMLGPFIDTIVVCTMTALVILMSVDPAVYKGGSLNGVLLTNQAFSMHFPVVGTYVLGFAILLFAVSTVLGGANYMQKCWNYLFKGRFGCGNKTFIAVYVLVTMLGALTARNDFQGTDDVINFLDINFAFMAIPNMIVTLILAPRVVTALKKYWADV